MATYYKNKFRNESTRLQNWDYRWDAAYFITICTKDRSPYFGEISNAQMNLSNIGVLADVFWHEIKNHAKNVMLDAFVVMPDHIHGILILTGNDGEHGEHGEHEESNPQTIGQQRFQNIGNNSISSIIGSYKSAVTKHARRLGFDFTWQTRFYDHIIRDEIALNSIRNYIEQNIAKWEKEHNL